MFYKSSVLAVAFVLLSVGNALAAEVVEVAKVQSATADSQADSQNEVNLDVVSNIELTAPPAIEGTELVQELPDSKLAAVNVDRIAYTAFSDVPGTVDVPNKLVSAGVEVPDISSLESLPLEPQPGQDLRVSAVSSLNDVLPEEFDRGLVAQSAPASAAEPKKWRVGVHAQASTTGFLGADVGYIFSPNLHARLGINTVGFNTNYTSQGLEYTASLNPTNVHLLGDFFPFGGGLRLTGGLVLQNNSINATGKSNNAGTITLDNVPYNSADVGTVKADGSFNSGIAPYLGLGFGTPISPGLGFTFDAGVMFAGSPTVRLSRVGGNPLLPAQASALIDADLKDQETKTNNDIKGFNVYPVISIGVSYAF